MQNYKNSILKLSKITQFEDIDLEFGRFLRQLHPDIEPTVLAAALLTSRAYRHGDVCLQLKEYAGHSLNSRDLVHAEQLFPSLAMWKKQLLGCEAVGKPGDFKPLILDDTGRLYLHKLWQYERDLVTAITKKLNRQSQIWDVTSLTKYLNLIFGEQESVAPDWQKTAAVLALINDFTIISGGPGTGKTTTVVKLLALMAAQATEINKDARMALAAPTGKAAARMEESIRKIKLRLDLPQEIGEKIPTKAITLHRLLGAQRHTPEFAYNKENPLPCDVVILDEASMVDQMMMSKLMDALLEHTKLILLGDKDQLASVEAGSILGDLCGDRTDNLLSTSMANKLNEYAIPIPASSTTTHPVPLTDHIILLKKNYRFKDSSGIGLLTRHIKKGEAEKAVKTLQDASLPSASWINVVSSDDYRLIIKERMITCFKEVVHATDMHNKFDLFNRFCILAAHRRGPWGVEFINDEIERALEEKSLKSPYQTWYNGKPVIINKNDHAMGLSNGDFGICSLNSEGNAKVYFLLDGKITGFAPSRLPDYSTAFGLTIHKSQGSEFKHVLLVLPDRLTKVLSRELLYTGVSRAQNKVEIISTPKILREIILKKTERDSGLSDYLWTEKTH